MELLAIPGSLRSASSNRTLLEAAAVLAPEGVTVSLSEHLATLLLGKPVAIWRVSARGEHAHASLVEILTTMSMQLVPEAAVTLPLLNAPPDLATLVATPALSGPLREALAAFARVIRERATNSSDASP